MPNYQRAARRRARPRAAHDRPASRTESGADLQGVAWETEVIGASPARAIADIARTRDADEIIVGTRGYGRARALLGSVAHELIHLADCPITVIPERVVDRDESREKAGAAS